MGSRFFSVHLAHQVDFEIALGKQALELRVLELKRFQTLYVVWGEAGKVLAPDVDGLLADFVLLRGFRDGRSVSLVPPNSRVWHRELFDVDLSM